jgi:acetyl esterase/lipase
VESTGSLLGMSGHTLSILLTGDSAGATIAVNALLKLIETRHQRPLPLPSAVVLSYAALDFNFTSWMTPANLRVLRSEQKEGTISGEVVDVKDHFKRNSPLSMANERKIGRLKRRKSWRDVPSHSHSNAKSRSTLSPLAEDGMLADMEGEDDGPSTSPRQFVTSPVASEQPPPLTQSTLERHQIEHSRPAQQTDVATLGTRITMTSRTGYFQDKIVTPSMVSSQDSLVSFQDVLRHEQMRAMALLYIGPKRNPDFATDYHISPVLTPAAILAQFPPVLMHCGEKDVSLRIRGHERHTDLIM